MKYLLLYLRLHNVSTHRNFHQNRFINEFARKNLAKNREEQADGVVEVNKSLKNWQKPFVNSLKIF